MSDNADAIVISDVVKSFRKSTIRREYTTFKSELVRWLRGQRQKNEVRFIEALRGIDLRIPRGQTIGILGRNGSGKSTLLKLITGIYTPTSGSIQVNGRISALLDLGAGFHPDFSGRENILINGIILGMTRAEVQARMDEIIAFSELGDFIDEPVRTYSSGMYMRLAFSVATHVDPDILIIDEILAVGDEHFGKKSLAKMTEFKRRGKTIVLVTHDLGTVERWCDQAAWIDAGRIRRFGPSAQVAAEYRQAVALAEQQNLVLTPAGLAEGGGALPTVDATTRPETGPQVGAGNRWGSFDVQISDVRLLDGAGQQVTVVDTEQPLQIQIDYMSKRPIEDVGFGISLRTGQGVEVYGTNTFIESVPLPKPLPSKGSLRLRLERVGLVAGNYNLDVRAHSQGGTEYDVHRDIYRFTVQSAVPDTGLARPPHRWILEEGQGTAQGQDVAPAKPAEDRLAS